MNGKFLSYSMRYPAIFLCLISLPVLAQTKKIKPPYPGTSPVLGNYLFAAQAETSNGEYLAFLNSLQRQGKLDEYKKNLPDSTQWQKRLLYSQPFVNYYFRHPAYSDYPVVNISFAQAKAFCAWLTDSINATLAGNKLPYARVIVRLPTKEEWMYAARGGLDSNVIYPWGTASMRLLSGKFQGKMQANFKRYDPLEDDSSFGYINDASTITSPVKSYWPNGYGLYNMSGNAAELISDGSTKGGSWWTTAHYLRIDAEDIYENDTAPDPGIGFRYFIEVITFKPGKFQPKKITTKYLEQSVIRINDTLFGGIYEVSNGLYRHFNPRGIETYNAAYAIDSAQWAKFTPYTYMQSYGSMSEFDNYPVVNISYEAAVSFLQWLTDLYNESPNRKYRQVEFRLPTEKEWELMAKGERERSLYPWGGPYARNSRGGFLANYTPYAEYRQKVDTNGRPYYDFSGTDISSWRKLDEYEFLAPIDAFYMQRYGYNYAGNAAEMVTEKGVSKGGSWNSTQEYITVESRETYTGPTPTLGFRYVMRVIVR